MGVGKPDVGQVVDTLICTGCEACSNICPVDAICMKPDRKGFLRPSVDSEACIACGRCVTVCPVLYEKSNKVLDPVEHVYAAYSSDEEIRYKSTSGGLFTELASVVLSNGGVVFGAAYDKDNRIVHTHVQDIEDLPCLRQSKYAQSVKGDAYSEAKRFLDEGRTVAFAGAPCEIAALKALVGNPTNLITIDFLCLGCNSPMVYRRYIDSLEQEANGRATRVWFKNKELGWNRFSTRVDFENGEVYRKDRWADGFMRGYIVHPLYVRPCCEHCRFKGTPHGSDVTLGDFWGIESVIPEIDTSHGVSVVFANTLQGVDLFEKATPNLVWFEVRFEQALTPANMNALLECVKLDPRSEKFYAELEDHGFTYAIKRNAGDSLATRARRFLRKLLSKEGI